MVRGGMQRSWRGLIVGAVLAAGVAVAPGVATAQQPQCPEASPSYTDACGPTFVLPGWGDAGGWTDPSQYSTIQLADLNGDGRDELIGRNDEGLEIWWFDTTFGQWRPQVDANGVPQTLSDFGSPAPGATPPGCGRSRSGQPPIRRTHRSPWLSTSGTGSPTTDRSRMGISRG
jgi:hypothetical protein